MGFNPNEIPQEYIDLFVSETKDYIATLNNLLLRLEKEKDNKELILEAFRLVHSIKGNAGTLGLSHIVDLAHAIENVLTTLKDGKIEVTESIIDTLLKGIDKLAILIDNIKDKKSLQIQDESKKILGQLKSLADEKKLQEEIAKTDEKKAEKKVEAVEGSPEIFKSKLSEEDKAKIALGLSKGMQCYAISLILKDISLKIVNAFTLLHKLGEIGDIIMSMPDFDRLARGEYDNEVSILMLAKKYSSIEEALKGLNFIKEYRIKLIDEKQLDLRDISSYAKAQVKRCNNIAEDLIKRIEEIQEGTHIAQKPKQQNTGKIEEIKVKVKSLDKLFNLVGELVLIKSRLNTISRFHDISDLKEALAMFERLLTELQDEITRMRLIPLNHIFNTIPRMLRDMAKKAGKEIDVILEGGEISLDKKIIEEIMDPLTHIIRNAVDHGIELPEERVKKGKPRVGTVKISASREGEYVIISVEDDGKGMDPEEIKKRAIELGLISPSVAESMSDEEALMLITLPGFTTKRVSGKTSGRGVGMDVVKRKIEELGGSLEIWSIPDRGTRISLKIPLTMATMKSVLVNVADEIYAIPISSIDSIVKTTEKTTTKTEGQEVLMLHDEIIPLYSLSKLLKMNNKQKEDYVVIVKKKDKRIGFKVLDVLGEEDVVIKPISKLIRGIPGIVSTTVLGDGRVCFILDPLTLIKYEG